MRDNLTSPSAILNSSTLIFGLFAIASGGYFFWDSAPSSLSLSTTHLLVIAVLLALCGQALRSREGSKFEFSPIVLGLGLGLLFCSDWFQRGYNIFSSAWVRGEILLFALVFFVASTTLKRIIVLALLPATIILMSVCFWLESGGQVLFSDDHPSFIWRLTLLKENFPQIPFYYPLWNGGMDARDFFATGVLNIFLLFYPLWSFFDVSTNYNIAIATLLFVLLPCSLFFSARLLRFDNLSACLAGILSLSFSLLWYRWALKYGTLGFVTSAILMPVNLALLARILDKEQEKLRFLGLAFLILFSLMLLWSMSGVVFIPALGLLCVKLCFDKVKRKRLVIIVLLLCLINLPWLAVFWKVSNVSSFLKIEQPSYGVSTEVEPDQKPKAEKFRHKTKAVSLKASLKTFRESAISVNPLILLLLLPGLLLLRSHVGLIWGTTALWLLFLGSIVVTLKPQLELDRMLLVLFLIGIVPSARALSELLMPARSSTGAVSYAYRVVGCLAFGFLLAAVLASASALRNRSLEKFYFAGSDVNDLAQAIKDHAGTGRVLFSGFVLHELSHGHVAPLTELAQVPLIASSHVHNLWRYRQVFPESFISRGDQGIKDYLDLYNVSCVFAHERTWREYFKSKPDEYTLLGSFGRFAMFKRLAFNANYFVQGEGEVLKQSGNALELRALSSDLVLKFNYFPFLKSSACNISEYKASPELSLIKLSACPLGESIEIKATPAWERLLE